MVPFTEISQYVKDATLSIEDKEFYTHGGVKPLSILRAVLVNTASFSYSQGGSTITQQVVKNSILTGDKRHKKTQRACFVFKTRKNAFKERIFDMYLNEIPYGGSLYGVEEASQAFFGKKSKDVTIAEAAYLASLPQAPSFYSPYGKNKEKLDERKNVVLKEMLRDGKISDVEYQNATTEEVVFLPKSEKGIKAPHFVMLLETI